MRFKEHILKKLQKYTAVTLLIENTNYRVIAKAVFSLIFNLFYVFYYGILGTLYSSIVFVASSLYYLVLSVMRFFFVINRKTKDRQKEKQAVFIIGIMFIVLSIVFHIMIILNMKYTTATVYGTITMITIATLTFARIIIAVISAGRYRRSKDILIKAFNKIRYSEVAVSLLTMQQSMLASFGSADNDISVILNALTGLFVCIFIFTLGIITLKTGKENNYGKI